MNFSISPNPASNQLKVHAGTELLGTRLEIYSMLGQKLIATEVISENFSVGFNGSQKQNLFIANPEGKHLG